MNRVLFSKYAFLIGLAICLSPPAIAQDKGWSKKQFSFRGLTVDHGLSQNSVVSIAQDSTGFLWFATQDGLNRYDGKKFIYFDKQFEDVTRQNYSKLGKIYTDREGTVWVITLSGVLQKYDLASRRFQQVSNIEKVSSLFQDSRNNYFVGTYGNGLYKIRPATGDTIQLLNPGDKTLAIFDFLETGTGILAAGAGKTIKIANDQYRSAATQKGINYSALSRSKDHRVYLGSYGEGLFIRAAGEKRFEKFLGFAQNPFPDSLVIEDLLVDKRQRLWVGTYGEGAYLIDFNNKSIRHFTANKNDPYALHYNDILSLYEDFTGTIWLGTDGAGLSYFDEYLSKFNVMTDKQVPKDVHLDVIRAIAVNKDVAWLGTSGKGLTKIDVDKKEYTTLSTENSALSGNRIMSLLHDGTLLWIGHQIHGLQAMDTRENIISFEETSDFTIWKILKTKTGKLWLCTRDHGLVKFDKAMGVIAQFNLDNSVLPSNNIRTAERAGNVLWLGTENKGLFKLDERTGIITKIPNMPDKIKSLYFDGKLLWIGTNGNGLKAYHPQTRAIQVFTTENGLSNNVIYGILPGDEGKLWLSSNKGITRFSLGDNGPEIENYRNYDGLQASEFNTGAYFKDSSGTLYFGGLEGLNWFNPEQLTYHPVKPRTVITGIKVFNEDKALAENQHFNYQENTLTFNFASLHFSQPSRNQFRYRLLGNDDGWITSGNNNIAHYTNLSPGRYEFQAISSNYDKVWNTVPATYSFTILKPWYATHLALVCYALILLLLSYCIYRYLKWRWELKNQLRLEHEETKRLKKLDELKTRLYTNISHEFRTPLTLISGPVENQLNKPNLTENDKKELHLVKHNADRLLALINQMMDLSLLDSGQIKLKIGRGNINALLLQLIAAFRYRAGQKKITLETSVQGLHDCWFDQNLIEKVVSNLLSNAVKYAPENSTVLFNASEKEGMLTITVVNETSDLQNTNLSKLFNRFYQDNEATEGVGIGLALVRELVMLAKGSVTVNTIENTKIQFSVNLPVDNAAFDSAEFYTESKSEPSKTALENTPEDKKPVLLLVEDDKEMRSFLISGFIGSYQILEAENGETGIEQAQKYLPDLIISDVMMPVKNGFALCDEIKQNALTSHIPVVLLTAKAGEENEIEGFKTGADAWFTKPFNVEKLHIRVEKLIESRRRLAEHFSRTFTIKPDLAITSTEEDFLNRMQEVLDKHITDPELSSEAFSKLMNMSRSQLHRKLRSIVGMSTTAFIRSQRLKIACSLLEETDAAVSEIAYQIGFNSVSYFISCFNKTYGLSPSEYREKQLKL